MSPRKKTENTATPPPTEGPFASSNGAVAEFTPAETDAASQRNLTPADVVPFADTEAAAMEDAQAEGQDNHEALPSLDVPQPASQATVEVLEEDWTRLMALLTSVENARGEYTSAKEEASRAKKALETAQEALERALDRIRAGKEANQQPPLPFNAPAGTPEPSPDGLPYDGIHQSDVVNDTPVYDRHMKIKETSAWLIERGWKHCDPEHCERYDEATLDSLLAWARGDSDIPEIDGLTVDAPASE